MNVDEAMETAAAYLSAHEQEQEPLFDSEEVAITLAAEVERLRAELAAAKADVERLNKMLQPAAQSASVCPVKVNAFVAAKQLLGWLRDRMKDATPPAT